MGLPCHICGKPIRYDEPSDYKHPLSFVIDEVIPISKYYIGGYTSERQAAEDWNNLKPAHYACNAAKGNKILSPGGGIKAKINQLDGDW